MGPMASMFGMCCDLGPGAEFIVSGGYPALSGQGFKS